MILEVVDGRTATVRTRVRLDTLPLTLGRGYDNDLILDDPYVDARHARIVHDDAGGLTVEDLGSRNGLTIAGEPATRTASIPVAAGAQVRIGRTTLRFRATDEVVPPALPHGVGRDSVLVGVLESPWTRLGVCAAACAAAAWLGWRYSVERSAGADVFAAISVFLFFGAMWAGVWAVASRIVVQRFHFTAHFAVFSALMLASTAYTAVTSWLIFLFPDNAVSVMLGWAAGLSLTAVTLAAHLAFSSSMTRARRWRIGLIASGLIVAFIGLAELLIDDEFTDVPSFSAVMKPVPAQLLPALSVEEFGSVVTDLKDEVDALRVSASE